MVTRTALFQSRRVETAEQGILDPTIYAGRIKYASRMSRCEVLPFSTSANWKPGDDVVISGSVSDDEARKKYPGGWKAPRPHLRIVPQPEEEAASGCSYDI
jgi:hypothetical protein